MLKKLSKKPFVITGSLLLLMSSAGTTFAAYSHTLHPTVWSPGRSSVIYTVQSTFDSTTKTQIQSAMNEWNSAIPFNFLYKSGSETSASSPTADYINTFMEPIPF
ncbi:hypothetical protein [Paenibacillus sp. DMB5]|uniref:hypothetical protein n=1 Tax=Paenibacillus sp. DMB5 TaxID=1780103 RepID=UPI000A5C004E|nr:hypothetical protein [Paenibacillus sp. DMB5]